MPHCWPKGDRRKSRAVFNRLTADLQADTRSCRGLLLRAAIGDGGRALKPTLRGGTADGWARGGPLRDGISTRHQAYRMHDSTDCVIRPRFQELVILPEAALGLRPPATPTQR